MVSLAEFVRKEPIESEMRRAIDAALRAVPGVSGVEEADREVWAVHGTPTGEALVLAAGDVVDRLAGRVREQLGL
jgi:hypothetical protein